MPTAFNKNFSTHYDSVGTGEALVLLHGVGLDNQMWAAQKKYFSSRGYRVICPDMLGHGLSQACPEDVTLDSFVEQLEELAEGLTVETFHLVGFSMGGLVAEAYAILYPERVITLTISNCVGIRDEVGRKDVLSRVELVQTHGLEGTVTPALSRWFTTVYRDKRPDVIESIRERLMTNEVASYVRAYRIFATADAQYFDRLDEISCPTLVVTGADDLNSSPLMARDIGARIPKSRVCVISGAKHMLPVESSEQFNQLLSEFLRTPSESIKEESAW